MSGFPAVNKERISINLGGFLHQRKDAKEGQDSVINVVEQPH